MAVTIYEVAKEAGVSIATVSRVINKTGKVREATEKKVTQAIKKLGFTPNVSGRNLGSSEKKTIMLVFPFFATGEIIECLKSVEEVVKREHYDMLTVYVSSKDDQVSFMRYIEGGVVGGCIFSGIFTEELDLPVPAIYLNDSNSARHKYSVDFDSSVVIADFTRVLISRGRRKFAFVHVCSITTGEVQSFSKARFNGMLQALKENGIEYDEDMTSYCGIDMQQLGPDLNYDRAVETVRRYAQMPKEQRPDAILCAYDVPALACINMLKEEGIKVPQDIAVVGFNNSSVTAYTKPHLTSVPSPYHDFGKEAAELLISVMRGEIEESCTRTVETYVIERGSTNPELQ